jgi:hypothetical protein
MRDQAPGGAVGGLLGLALAALSSPNAHIRSRL